MKWIKEHFLPVVLGGLACVFIFSTGWQRHQLHPLKPVASELLPVFSIKDRGVAIIARAVTAEESKRYFGHDLVSRGVQPLQLMIQNNTSNEYSLCPSSIDLDRVEAGKIAFKVTKSAIPRAIAYRVASLLFWPFAIPSTIDSIRVMTHHNNLKKDLKAKSVKDEIVAPYSTFHRILFVPVTKFKDVFKVTLIDLDTLNPKEFSTTVENPLGDGESEVELQAR